MYYPRTVPELGAGQFEWELLSLVNDPTRSGQTPTGSQTSLTGPIGDHTSGAGQYIFTEARIVVARPM